MLAGGSEALPVALKGGGPAQSTRKRQGYYSPSMRLDKLTTKFQEALQDAQSIAVGHDNQYIEPAHVLLAMVRQEDAGT